MASDGSGDEQRALSTSFGAAAAAYAEHRPDYARAAVAFVLERAPGRRLLDLGAGTGKLTEVLVAMAADVVAVEPDPEMLATLRHALPQVRARSGHAEAIPLPDASVDAVVVGNALHWFAMDVAEEELARVLSPHGVLAALWNVVDDRVDWVAGLVDVAGPAAIGPRDTCTSWDDGRAFEHLPDLASLRHFASPRPRCFAHSQRRTADSLVATLATRAGLLVMPAPQREVVLTRIRAYLDTRPETAHGAFVMPMQTWVLLLERR